jgi:hypothetical protein
LAALFPLAYQSVHKEVSGNEKTIYSEKEEDLPLAEIKK